MAKGGSMNNVGKYLRKHWEDVTICILLVVILVLLVQHLMNRNNEQFQGSSNRLVLYYAPWCPHCTDLVPQWRQMGTSHQGVQIEMVDCEANKDVAKRENIEGFPTIRLYKNGNVKEYSGERSKQAIILWLERQL